MSIDIDRNQSALATLELAIEDGLPAIMLAHAHIAAVRVTWRRDQDRPFVVVKQEGEQRTIIAFFEDLDDALDCMEAVIAGEWNEHEQTWLAAWWDALAMEAGHPAALPAAS